MIKANGMNIHWMCATAAAAVEPEVTWGTFVGFVLLFLALLLILKQGKPRPSPRVVESQRPQNWTDTPYFAERRGRAVAAAFALHHHLTSGADPK